MIGRHLPYVIDKEKRGQVFSELKSMRSATEAPLGMCMAWGTSCKKPIGSHSLSKCWLKLLSDPTGHVEGFEMAIKPETRNFSHRPVGWKEASVFAGFCADHDSQLFRSIDSTAIVLSDETKMLIAYRALCREIAQKNKSINGLLASPAARDENFHKAVILPMQYQCIDLLTHKLAMEECMDAGNYMAFDHLVIPLNEIPWVAACGTFSPSHTINGRELQMRLDWMNFNLIPQNGGGILLFSWQKRRSKNVNLFLKSFQGLSSIQKAVAIPHMVFETTDNVFASRERWNALSEKTQLQLIDLYLDGIKRGGQRKVGNPFAMTIKDRAISVY